jgi:hypothetical protein
LRAARSVSTVRSSPSVSSTQSEKFIAIWMTLDELWSAPSNGYGH